MLMQQPKHSRGMQCVVICRVYIEATIHVRVRLIWNGHQQVEVRRELGIVLHHQQVEQVQ